MLKASKPVGTFCSFRSSKAVGPNVPKLVCYAPKCDKVLHSYYCLVGVFGKNKISHFDLGNIVHPYTRVMCTIECYRKAQKHFSNMSVQAEDRNIPWNRDGQGGAEDPNNLENILIAWLCMPGNYEKFRSPLRKDQGGCLQRHKQKILDAGTMKIRKASTIQQKIQSTEKLFCATHDWVLNDWVLNTGVGVTASNGQVTFKGAVKKRFAKYYNLVGVMVERASRRPQVTTDDSTQKWCRTGLDEYKNSENKLEDKESASATNMDWAADDDDDDAAKNDVTEYDDAVNKEKE
jgi:hypothetical protein